jgi:hypothetical protein
MALYGYARVSTLDQDLTVQEQALRVAGCDVIRAEIASGAQRAGAGPTEWATGDVGRMATRLTAPGYDRAGRAGLASLLASKEPSVRMLARRDLLGERVPLKRRQVLQGSWVRALLAGQRTDGDFGVPPYSKWTGAHWRLVSLVELGVPQGYPQACAAADGVLDWLAGENHRSGIRVVNGLVRAHASQEGNALAVAARLGMAGDPRARLLAESLLEWQWPDGGWNCDVHAQGRRSSFHESLIPMWGLHEYAAATGDADARRAALRTGELLLDHRLFRSLRTGRPIHSTWTKLHYPAYWHYDILQALLMLSRMGLASDPRASDAIGILESRRRPDGTWAADGVWWRGPDSGPRPTEVVDWGDSGPNEMITLNALRCLRAAGRLGPG